MKLRYLNLVMLTGTFYFASCVTDPQAPEDEESKSVENKQFETDEDGLPLAGNGEVYPEMEGTVNTLSEIPDDGIEDDFVILEKKIKEENKDKVAPDQSDMSIEEIEAELAKLKVEEEKEEKIGKKDDEKESTPVESDDGEEDSFEVN